MTISSTFMNGLGILCILSFLLLQPCASQDFKWQKLLDIGNAARKRGDFNKAEEYYRLAVETAEKSDSNQGSVAICLIAEADACCDAEKFATADRLYCQALKIREKITGLESAEVSEVLQKQVALEYRHRNYGEAENLYKRILDIEEKSSNPNQSKIVSFLTKLGNCARSQGDQRIPSSKDPRINTKYADAEKYFARAVKESERLTHSNGEETAIALESLAHLYGQEEKLEEEAKLYRRILAIREKTLKPTDRSLAKPLADLSIVLIMQKKVPEAERLMNRALVIWNGLPAFRSTEENSPISRENMDCIIAMNNIGVKLLNHGKNVLAESVFNALIHLDPRYSLSYENRSILRRKRGDEKGANEDMKKAEQLRKHPR